MKTVCPCCHQEFSPPVLEEAEDMGNLFDCDHCQSVLKWDSQSLKVVYESQNKPASPPSAVDEEVPELKKEDVVDERLVEKEESLSQKNMVAVDDVEQLMSEENPILYEEKPVGDETADISESSEESLFEQKERLLAEEFSSEEIEEEEHQDFSDVEEYGNAQATSGKGFLRYDLRVDGVDSVEIEQQVLSVLEDPRFHWDAKEIIQAQKEGVLVIKNLNPIKAMCLVSELSFLPVELSWEQYMALNISKSQEN